MSLVDELRASHAAGSRRFDAAIERYRRILAKNPDDSVSLAMIAHCYEWKGDLDAALEAAHRVLAKDPNDFEMLMLAVRYWDKQKDEERVYHYASRLVATPPNPPSALVMPWYIKGLTKLLMLLPPIRRLVESGKGTLEKSATRHHEAYEWAVRYKSSYETRHGRTDDPVLH